MERNFTTAAYHSFFAVLAVSLNACSITPSSATEDTSASGAAASSVAGAIAGSSSSATVAMYLPNVRYFHFTKALFDFVPDALAATACPTLASAAGAGCTQVSSNVVAVNYGNGCSFGNSGATWTGILQVTDASGIACGTYPATSFSRQFVSTVGGNASTGTRNAASGTKVTIDHASMDLGNYEGDTISFITNSGYGSSVARSGVARNSVTVQQRIYVEGKFDYSVSGTLAISETASTAASRIVNGTVTTYHNMLRAKGTTTFNSVSVQNTCCLPVSGFIKTTFAKTSQSGPEGVALDGKSETLTFAGCGVGTLTDSSGMTTSVALNFCL